MRWFLIAIVAALVGCAKPPAVEEVEKKVANLPRAMRDEVMPYLEAAKVNVAQQANKLFKNYDPGYTALKVVEDAISGKGMPPTAAVAPSRSDARAEGESWSTRHVGEICRHGYLLIVSDAGGIIQLLDYNGHPMKCD